MAEISSIIIIHPRVTPCDSDKDLITPCNSDKGAACTESSRKHRGILAQYTIAPLFSRLRVIHFVLRLSNDNSGLIYNIRELLNLP